MRIDAVKTSNERQGGSIGGRTGWVAFSTSMATAMVFERWPKTQLRVIRLIIAFFSGSGTGSRRNWTLRPRSLRCEVSSLTFAIDRGNESNDMSAMLFVQACPPVLRQQKSASFQRGQSSSSRAQVAAAASNGDSRCDTSVVYKIVRRAAAVADKARPDQH